MKKIIFNFRLASIIGIWLFAGQTWVFGQVTNLFTTAVTTNWVCPAGVFSATVECWGGGGSGGAGINGGSTSSGSGAGGGGGGAYVFKTVAVTPGNSYSVVVGSGGAAGTTSNPGSDSTFATTVAVAKGGTAGASVNGTLLAGAGGAGGSASASTGDIKFSGGNGATGVAGANPNGGGGGGSSAGTAANGNDGASSGTAGAAPTGGAAGGAGATSSNPGGGASSPGGGGGGAKTASATQRNGGAGGSGQIRIIYTVSSAPTVSVTAASSLGTNFVTLNGNVTSDGGSTVTERGFGYRTTTGATTNDNRTLVPGTTGTYSTNLSGLLLNTRYFYIAYAINSLGTSVSSETNFWTLANRPASPAIGNISSTNLTLNIGGGDGNPAATAYAILVTNGNSYVQPNGAIGVTAVYQTSNTWATVTVSNLSPSTTYGFAAIATNGAGTATAFSPTNVITTGASVLPAITATPGTLNFGPVLVNGTSPNLNYSASAINLSADLTVAASANFQVSTNSATGFASTLTLTPVAGTVPSTTVFVRFNPTAQTGYSGFITNSSPGAATQTVSVSGAGANLPAVTTQLPTATNTTSATFAGTVTASNNAVLTDRGFFFSSSPGVTLTATQVSEGGTAQSAFTRSVTGLNVNQIYYYRSYAVNAIGTNLDSSDVSFYTLAAVPLAPVVGNATTNSLTVAIVSGDGNPNGTAYAIQETGSGNFVQANGTLGATPVFQNTNVWGQRLVTGLAAGQSYTFQVRAQNGASFPTAFGSSTTSSTANQPFGAGNVVLLSADTASANNTTFTIIELTTNTPNQTAVQAIAVNGTSGPNALRTSGSASSVGYLANSDDGTLLLFSAHNSTNSSVNANTLTARGVGTLNTNAVFNLATTYTGSSGQQTRAAGTVNNSFFFIGDQNGLYTNGTSSAVTSGNYRSVKSFGGTAYIFAASTTVVPVSTVTAAGTITALPGLANGAASRQDFYLVSSGSNGSTFDVLYVLDTTSATVGSILKYSLVSGSWTANGSYATTFGGFGLCAVKSGSGATLFVTSGTGATAANNLIRLTDTNGFNVNLGINTPDNVTLYTAGASATIKGVAFAPRALIPAISITGTPAAFTNTYGTASAAQNFTVTGANLSGNITATAPTGFEISTNVSTTYGSTATFLANGSSVNGTLFVRLAATAPVGGYNSQSFALSSPGANTANFTTTASGNSVLPKGLTVTANSTNRVYGTANPAFTANYSGFANGETVSVLSGSPSLTATATISSNAGSYVITAAIGTLSAANYSFSFVNGTLTITKATTIFTLSSSGNPSGFGDGLTFSANNFAADLTGSVQFVTNGASFGSAVTIASSSAISLTANGLPRGNTNVVLAVYSGDANYFSFTNSFVQTVTNHPPIASNVNFSRNAGITSLHIAISNLLANVSDVDGDSIALVSASVTTNGITLVNTSGYLNYFNTNAVNDEFTYTVTDGFGGTNTAKVSLVVNNTFIGGQAQGIALVNNTATLNFAGIPTYGYAVQRSTNLITWDDVFSTNAPASGAFQFVDNLNPVPPPSVFYRLRYQP